MVQKHTSTRWSSSFVAIKARTITCLVATLIVTLFSPLAPAAAINPGDLDTTFGTTGSINVNELFDRPVNVERIATDDEDRIVALASFSDGVADNHILFRLNQNGTYDDEFGDSELSLNGRNYILVLETSLSFTYERVDLEIDSQDRLLVLISGASGFGDGFFNQSFVKRFLDTGIYDPDFGVEGTIDFLSGSGSPPLFLTDLSLDGPSNGGGFLVAGFTPIPVPVLGANYLQLGLQIRKFNVDGQLLYAFGNGEEEEEGFAIIDTEVIFGLPDLNQNSGQFAFINDVRITPDYADGYLIAYFGLSLDLAGSYGLATGIVRLLPSGIVDEDFASQSDYSSGIDNDYVEVFASSNHLLFYGFTFTDIVPDGLDGVEGNEGFLISGTGGGVFYDSYALSLLLRVRTDGTFDPSYKHSAFINGESYDLTDANFDPEIPLTFSCYNQALFRNIDPNESSTAIIVGNSCGNDFDFSATSELLGYLKSGAVDTNFGTNGSSGKSAPVTEDFTNVITQIEQTKNGKILVLRGAEPTTGILGFLWKLVQGDESVESEVTISSYRLRTPVTFTLSRDSETATVGETVTGYTVAVAGNIEAGVGDVEATYSISPALGNGLTFDTSTARISGVPTTPLARQTFTVTGVFETFSFAFVYRDTSTATFTLTINAVPAPTPPAPTPVPYLKTLTAPKLRLSSGKLLCTPGTYNAGYTLDGVIQGSTTTLFTPSSFTYNLLINGITQTSLAVTSNTSSQSWNMPTGTAGALLTCSVTVTANGLTNTDKSNDNPSAVSSALSTQATSIAIANADYSALLSANSKAYQKALTDNRTKWRSDTEKIRTDYYAERDRIKSLPSTRTTRALSSAALKAYTAALKKSAADYKASGPAALAAKDVADKAAFDAKSAAIAKANAAYGTAIESIGFGVLIP